jgi:hypothetical protein
MNISYIEGRFAMYCSTQTIIPLQTVVIGGYIMDEQESDGTHYNLPRNSNFNFNGVLKALKAMLCVHGSTTHSTASS